MPRNGTVGSYGSSIFRFLRSNHIDSTLSLTSQFSIPPAVNEISPLPIFLLVFTNNFLHRGSQIVREKQLFLLSVFILTEIECCQTILFIVGKLRLVFSFQLCGSFPFLILKYWKVDFF